MLEACYKGGINFIDCAEVYGGGGSSERVLGDAIKIGMDKGTWERADLVISTKAATTTRRHPLRCDPD